MVSVIGLIGIVVIVGLAVRSCSPSRTVGHGAVEEACFDFWRAVQLPNRAAAHPLFERAQDAASRSQDPSLAADVARVSNSHPGQGNLVLLNDRAVQSALAECKAKGWNATDPCTYGATVCASTTTVP